MARSHGEPCQPAVAILVSPDAEAESIEEQDYPTLEVVRLERAPTGIVEALDRGLGKTKSELVGYLGPGEGLLPGAVAALAGALVLQPVAVVAYAAFNRVDGRGETIEAVVPEEFDFWRILRLQYCPVGPAPILRREAAAAAVRLDPNFRHCRELAFWLRISREGALRRLSAPLSSRCVTSEQSRAPGGLDAARERIRLHERFIAEAEFPADPNQGALSAARNAFIAAATEIESGFNDPEERFFVADRFAREWPAPETLDPDANLALLEARYANLAQRLTRQRAVLQVLEGAVERREAQLSEPNGHRGGALRWSVRRLARRLREVLSGS